VKTYGTNLTIAKYALHTAHLADFKKKCPSSLFRHPHTNSFLFTITSCTHSH